VGASDVARQPGLRKSPVPLTDWRQRDRAPVAPIRFEPLPPARAVLTRVDWRYHDGKPPEGVQIDVVPRFHSRPISVRARTPHQPAFTFTQPKGVYCRRLKPVLDRLAAAIVLILTLPLFILCTVLVLSAYGRPIFYTQRRVGRRGRVFSVLKFRTMHPDRRKDNIPVEVDRRVCHKDPNDPRLTAVGRFLRKWSLDELPQLVNVLKGEMSLVGPRPELETIVARYAPAQHKRHVVKPGLTGLWQINARGDGSMMYEHLEWDLEYVEKISFRTDASIIARTPFAILGKRKGA
jgi:lipopolysaccharide/colanic/teichoic acid biosynthesis glycosyltransferase